MSKAEKAKSFISPDQKDDISLTSLIVRLTYAVWGSSLQKTDAIMSEELIANRIAKYPYLSKKKLIQKIAAHNHHQPIQYVINAPTQKIEEILLPDLADLGQVKMSHFWGNTGFHPDSPYPSTDNTVNEQELKNSAHSYMGSVILIKDEKNPENQKLIIAFRGSRGGHTSWTNFRNALKGIGNPDWVTDLDLGKYFSLAQSGIALFKRTVGKMISNEKSPILFAHAGICRTYYSCKPGMMASLAELGITSLNDFKGKIYITGHSLGGGIATICAYDLRGGFDKVDQVAFRDFTSRLIPPSVKETQALYVDDAEKISCITYGTPSLGNDLFVEDFKKLVPKNLRIIINGDPVAINYRHIFNIHHVHGKVCLIELIKDLDLKAGNVNSKFDFIDPKAHQFTKIMELLYLVLQKKPVVFVRTFYKTPLSLQAGLFSKRKKLNNPKAADISPSI